MVVSIGSSWHTSTKKMGRQVPPLPPAAGYATDGICSELCLPVLYGLKVASNGKIHHKDGLATCKS